MMRFLLLIFFTGLGWQANAQLLYNKEKLVSPYTLETKVNIRRAGIINNAEALQSIQLPGDEATTEKIQTALWSISQFLVSTPKSDSGIARLVKIYWQLDESTQRSLLEVLYALYPRQFYTEVIGILQASSHPKTFAMAAAYAFRAYPTAATKKLIRQKAASLSCSEGQALMVYNLLKYIDSDVSGMQLPPIDSLFAHQQVHGFKVIYSFQSFNRDIPGIAVVQQADGRFARDDSGGLRVFRQLARSASNLPWFISNGSTPQGLYSITGNAVSQNVFIGPTPNFQMVMMNEVNPPVFTHYFPPVFNAPPEKLYRSYLPANWQQWSGLMEAYDAGKIGRSEIIAHGSTIDPEWYAGKPYYPLTPTMGCLCGMELWDKKTGKSVSSDQLDLVNTFVETPGTQGFLFVINVDEKEVTLNKQKLQEIADRFEAGIKKPGVESQASK